MSVRVSVPNLNAFIREASKAADEKAMQRYNERQLEIGELFVQMCTKFVPFDFDNHTGNHLAYSGQAFIEGKDRLRVRWSRQKTSTSGKTAGNTYDIASMQYYGEGYVHDPPRTHHWNQTMMRVDGSVFRTRAQEILNKK